jgi:hypothetical protein
MGLFSSSDPIKQQEKMLAREEKNEDKSLKQAVKDLAHAEKEEHKALKVSPPDSDFSVSVPMIHRVPENMPRLTSHPVPVAHDFRPTTIPSKHMTSSCPRSTRYKTRSIIWLTSTRRWWRTSTSWLR